MARPKSFDVEEALEQAMLLFWHKGYKATSMRELLSRMNISRQSLYDTFGDKRKLFIRALAHYDQKLQALLAPLYSPDASLEAIREHFLLFVNEIAVVPELGACLMANAALELGVADKEVTEKIEAYFKKVEFLMNRAVANAIERKDIAAHHTPESVTRLFITIWFGLGIRARTGAPKEELISVMDTAFFSILGCQS